MGSMWWSWHNDRLFPWQVVVVGIRNSSQPQPQQNIGEKSELTIV